MENTQKIIRQKTLFDDENSDEDFLREELRKRRQLEIKRREHELEEKYTKSCQIDVSEVDEYIKQSIEQHKKMIIETFGFDIFSNTDWLGIK